MFFMAPTYLPIEFKFERSPQDWKKLWPWFLMNSQIIICNGLRKPGWVSRLSLQFANQSGQKLRASGAAYFPKCNLIFVGNDLQYFQFYYKTFCFYNFSNLYLKRGLMCFCFKVVYISMITAKHWHLMQMQDVMLNLY